MNATRFSLIGFIEQYASRLRFPYLFWLTAALFVLDLLVPDVIPFADEVLLGLATLLLGSWTRRRTGRMDSENKPPPPQESGDVIDVTPEDGSDSDVKSA